MAYKRIFALFLSVVTLMSVLAACSEKEPTGGSVTSSDPNVAQETEEDLGPYGDGIFDEFDYEGETFTIAMPTPDWLGKSKYIVESETGDTLNDAIYIRNVQVEDRFKISLEVLEVGQSGDMAAKIMPILAGDDAVDLICLHANGSAATFLTANLIQPWNDVPYVNFERPWWNSNIDAVLIGDNRYFTNSSLNWFTLAETLVVFFNQQVQETKNIEDMYALVNSGNWTLDKLLEITAGVSEDLDGNSVFDDDDMYGAVVSTVCCPSGFLYACDYKTVYDVDNEPVLNLLTDKFQIILDKALQFLYEENRVRFGNYEQASAMGRKIFAENRAFLYFDRLQYAEEFRSMEADYGIIPWPKYDEMQEKYTTFANDWGLVNAIPKSATDLDMIGAVVEALSAASYKLIVPAYKDIVLMEKHARDQQSQEMLDMIFTTVSFDIGRFYGGDYLIHELIINKNPNLSSMYTQRETQIQRHFDRIFDKVLG